MMSGKGFFDESGFRYGKPSKPALVGIYRNPTGRNAVFIVNGDKLRKLNITTLGTLSSWPGFNIPIVSPGAVMPIVGGAM